VITNPSLGTSGCSYPDTYGTPWFISGAIPPLDQLTEVSFALLHDARREGAALAAGIMKKRRKRAARKKNVSLIEAYLKNPEEKIPAPSPSYRAPHRIIEASLPGPDPRSAQTPEEFVLKMRQLKAYTGLTLRSAEDSAGKLGELPKSTLHDALKSKSLPKPLLLRRFLESCQLTDEQIAVWEAAHRRIAMEQVS
jgi:hypothetical protein